MSMAIAQIPTWISARDLFVSVPAATSYSLVPQTGGGLLDEGGDERHAERQRC
jgi:hypothetical protein